MKYKIPIRLHCQIANPLLTGLPLYLDRVFFMKECYICKEVKRVNEFYKSNVHKDNLSYYCKECISKVAHTYNRTKDGFFTQIYSRQRHSSRHRKHPMPDYTKLQLIEWTTSQPNFESLWANWVESGYLKMHKPSCDRLDNSKPYTLCNLQLVTWRVNNANSHESVRNGDISRGKPSKAVIGVHKFTGEVVKFHSQGEASRQTGIERSNITACCTGRLKTSGGYIWKSN